ncbi:MAG TPA: DUF6285 domain-containing protein [Leptospiraceae bacterium]|nr:DUF6285 domain-containing protein [Leptospiraceae bacterium]HRG73139.1 DUF6285 domain-containing protein [Leptospiraceae bacterium]
MQDRPDANILLEAIQDLLIKEVLPALKDNDAVSYKTLVSWNMLGVIGREIKYGESFIDQEIERVSIFLRENSISFVTTDTKDKNYLAKMELCRSLNEKLTDYIRKKKIADEDSALWNLVKESLNEKLRISNPRFGTGE